MRSGDLIILGSTEYHRHTVLAQGPQKPRVAKAAVLYFLPSVFMRSGALVEDAQYLAPFAVHERAASHLIPAATGVPGRVMRTMRQMALHVPAASALDRLALRTLLRVVLLDLVRHYAGKLGEVRSQERKREAIERLRPLYDHVDSNYREAIAVGEAAHVVGMSPARFRRFFKQVTGQSFTAYLASFRVAKAQQLLVRGQASLADIALEVGFCDQSYFGLVFRRIVGMTPRQYQLRFAV
jgi:AraC-like DNA-binding protein